ncbi:MAG: p-hydroxycinnamoyl CoA hydratase/lyase [Hyphomicrobiales bacterium]|nr:p-hydroxycinnamoyl CoA hydratase/lyase [Hyphomicrobiales bacterium]
MTSYETILVEKKDGITTVRFNRPKKKNAMSPTLHREMHAALRELSYDDETQVLVITGAGDAFCAGQDLKEYFFDNKDSVKQTEEIQRISHEWRHQILNTFPKPTIASINGYCFGGAFTVVASCDIAIAADEATFGLSEINFGSIPGGLVAKAISTEMNYRQMLYYSLTGEQFDGKRSVEIGFTTMSVPRAELEARTLAVANVLKAKDRHALRATKDAFKAVDIRTMSYEDARSWLKARLLQMTYEQKNANWLEHGIGKFIEGVYAPGKGAAPKAAQ